MPIKKKPAKTIKKERIDEMPSVLANLREISDNVKKCMANQCALTSEVEILKDNVIKIQGNVKKIQETLDNKDEGDVKAMEDLSGMLQNVTDLVQSDIDSSGPLIKQMAKDCKQHTDDRRATLCAGLMKLDRSVKCDSLTKGWQAFFACVGVRKGLSVTILEAMGQSQSGECSQHKLDLAYQTCLSSLFTFNVLGHLTGGGPK
jgi:hypothetical protein